MGAGKCYVRNTFMFVITESCVLLHEYSVERGLGVTALGFYLMIKSQSIVFEFASHSSQCVCVGRHESCINKT